MLTYETKALAMRQRQEEDKRMTQLELNLTQPEGALEHVLNQVVPGDRVEYLSYGAWRPATVISTSEDGGIVFFRKDAGPMQGANGWAHRASIRRVEDGNV